MARSTENSNKVLVISKKDDSPKYWMSKGEYTNIIVNAEQTNNEYVITDGIIESKGFVPDHYHKWEDQTFHVIEGSVRAKIGEHWFDLNVGDTVHCPRGTSHYIENNGKVNARLVSYIFPGNWAEEFFAETSRQNHSGEQDQKLIEEKFGVVYTQKH
ncbi:cupin domain-containing protein [Leptobacterium flavescens]|uniref:Cupin domain-containing protein n=1 Tax=Leptobacterium flavescens TaxID=472055 RepID=A0A6P0US90_9FLAO|nr:cupin domain-containing protein [Leptobacterium flavescens]NER15402.1 cupin domain-containing protein [Leptobacterium flavescens]